MNLKRQLYFEFIRDIIGDLSRYEENGLMVLLNMNVSLYEVKIISTIIKLKADCKNKSSEIAHHLNASRSSVSIALKGMEKKGFIRRVADSKDRRIVFVEPRKLSIEIIKTYNEIHQDIINKALSIFNDYELNEITQMTAALRNHIKSLLL